MSFAFLPEWSDVLPREGGHLVVLRGGGGKTALLEAMADALGATGLPVAVARSGADGRLDRPGLVRCPLDSLSGGAAPRLHVVAADGGPVGLTPAEVDDLGGALPDHVVIYETDSGAGRDVVRGRAADLPLRTSLLVTVAGLGAVGRPSGELAPPSAPLPETWLTPTDDGPVWSWDGLRALLEQLPDRPAGAAAPPPALPALLGLDDCLDSVGLFACLGRLMSSPRFPLVMIGDTSGPAPRLRTACVDAPERP